MALPVLRIGLIGLGPVGRGVLTALSISRERLSERLQVHLAVTRVAVRHPEAARSQWPGLRIDDDAAALAHDRSLDIVIDASNAVHAADWLVTALARGAGTVSTNKQSVATSPALLRALAGRHPLFHCEGAVAAAIPIVRTLRDGLDGEEIRSIRGVLNGTSTFVLSEIEHGASFPAALANAQSLGLTERNSAADFDGSDAAAKLAILATTAWREPVLRSAVQVHGLGDDTVERVRRAAAHGLKVRLVAEAVAVQEKPQRLVVEARVLKPTDPLSAVTGVTNAVEVHAALAGTLRWFGPGAGGDHTASAVVADVLGAARALLGKTTERVAA